MRDGAYTESTLDLESGEAEVDMTKHKCGEDEEAGHEFEAEEESCERTSRTEGRGRGCKTFYGARLTVTVKCADCGSVITPKVTLEDEVQASSMEEV